MAAHFMRTVRTVGLFWVPWALVGLAGCDPPFVPTDAALSPEAIATRDAPAELKFQGRLAGEATLLLVHDCEVYRVDQSESGAVQWTSALAPDFYPFWTVCQRESMSYKGSELTVTLGRMALGAGRWWMLRHGRHLPLQGRARVEKGVIRPPQPLRQRRARHTAFGPKPVFSRSGFAVAARQQVKLRGAVRGWRMHAGAGRFLSG